MSKVMWRRTASNVIFRCGYGWGLAFQRYGGPWRDARKAFRQEFDVETIKRYRPIEEKASHNLLRNLLHSPHELLNHLRQSVPHGHT